MAVDAKVSRRRPKATQVYVQYDEETEGVQRRRRNHICNCSRFLVRNVD
jgi:hypothetical protein